jgi:hypothetical protein
MSERIDTTASYHAMYAVTKLSASLQQLNQSGHLNEASKALLVADIELAQSALVPLSATLVPTDLPLQE